MSEVLEEPRPWTCGLGHHLPLILYSGGCSFLLLPILSADDVLEPFRSVFSKPESGSFGAPGLVFSSDGVSGPLRLAKGLRIGMLMNAEAGYIKEI